MHQLNFWAVWFEDVENKPCTHVAHYPHLVDFCVFVFVSVFFYYLIHKCCIDLVLIHSPPIFVVTVCVYLSLFTFLWHNELYTIHTINWFVLLSIVCWILMAGFMLLVSIWTQLFGSYGALHFAWRNFCWLAWDWIWT